MNLEKQDMIKRMVNYGLVILIIHLLALLQQINTRSIIPIDIIGLLKTNYIFIIAFSYLLIKLVFIKENKEKNKMLPYFLTEVILLGLTISKIFMIINVIFLILLKSKEKKEEEKVEKNIKNYFKTHENRTRKI